MLSSSQFDPELTSARIGHVDAPHSAVGAGGLLGGPLPDLHAGPAVAAIGLQLRWRSRNWSFKFAVNSHCAAQAALILDVDCGWM